MAASVLVMGLLVLFALFFPQGAPAAIGAALAANLALGWLLAGSAGPRVALVGACTVAGGILGRATCATGRGSASRSSASSSAYALTMAVHPEALSLAPMGPELTSRFFGVSNLLETLLLAPALIGAKLLTDRFGWRAFVAVALLSLVTIAENQLGSDGGGAIVIGVAFAVLAVAMSGAGWRLSSFRRSGSPRSRCSRCSISTRRRRAPTICAARCTAASTASRRSRRTACRSRTRA